MSDNNNLNDYADSYGRSGTDNERTSESGPLPSFDFITRNSDFFSTTATSVTPMEPDMINHGPVYPNGSQGEAPVNRTNVILDQRQEISELNELLLRTIDSSENRFNQIDYYINNYIVNAVNDIDRRTNDLSDKVAQLERDNRSLNNKVTRQNSTIQELTAMLDNQNLIIQALTNKVNQLEQSSQNKQENNTLAVQNTHQNDNNQLVSEPNITSQTATSIQNSSYQQSEPPTPKPRTSSLQHLREWEAQQKQSPSRNQK